MALALFLGFTIRVNSSASDNVSGFAWGADWFTVGGNSSLGGMGWLSFNSINDHNPNTDGVQPSSYDYGVKVDSSGNITGYAWAGNSVDSNINGIGWIRFGGLSGFPSGPGTTPVNAKIVNGTLVGWARVCSVLATTNCTGNTLKPSTSTGGWDGWISLNGSGYEVVLNETTGAFSGFAWGGPDVLGWINFSQVLKDAPIVPPIGSLIFSADSFVVYPPSYQTILHWSSSLPLTDCEAKNNGTPSTSTWSGTVANPSVLPAPPASKTVSVPAVPTSTIYNLKCFNGGIAVSAEAVTLTRGVILEDVSLGYTKPVLNNGIYTTKLSWTTKNIVPNSCKASGGWSGNKTTVPAGSQDGTGSESDVVVPAIAPLLTRYTLTCTGFYTTQQEISTYVDINEKSSSGGSNRKPRYEED